MNTTTNPSPRTEQEHNLTAGAELQRRDHTSSANAVYETPPGADHRTFELTVASIYELWLLTTFTGYAGEEIWAGPLVPFRPIQMKLTYRQGTLELPEVRWLIDRVFEFRFGSGTLRPGVRDRASDSAALPRPQILAQFAEQVHNYLGAHDVVALVKYVSPIVDRGYFDVAAKTIPSPGDDLAAFERHLQRCMDCIRVTYIDDSFLR